jgi:hypothetical protein
MATGRAEVLKDMDLQSHGQKPSRTHRQRQMILALAKVIIQTDKCQTPFEASVSRYWLI